MIIQDLEFTLKDGREAVICTPREEHVQGLLDYLLLSAEETEFIMRYPEECGKYTYEGEKAWVESGREDPNKAVLVCTVDGKVAGNCEITFHSFLKTKHRAEVGIAILKEFWNLGIGTRFFQEMIRLAEEREEITQIELDVVEGNARARHLYEKMGFRIVSVLPNAIRLKNGALLNEYKMIREIERKG